MSASANPDIVDDGLVFLYDTDDRKSYKGEPTENLITQMSGSTTISYPQVVYISTALETNVTDSSATGGKYSRFTGNTDNNNNQLYSRFNSAGIDVRNSTITYSVYLKGSGTCHLSIYADNTGYGTSSTITLTNEWTRYTYTRAVTNYTTNCWVAVRGLLTTTDVYIAGQQAEIKSHATPFVDGTRSATQGLLDRTGTSTIDISNASFDSNAQMTFDGTDDYLDCGNIGISSSKVTFAAWVKFSGSSTEHIIDASGNTCHLAILGNKPYFFNGATYHTDADVITNGVWYYLTGVQSDTNNIYINGVLSSSKNSDRNISVSNVNIGRWQNGGRYFNGEIVSVRIYDRALTASEVLQNFNATKSRFGL